MHSKEKECSHSSVITSSFGREGCLESMYMDQLQLYYKKFDAAYLAIVNEYERACIRATTTRSRSELAEKSLWNPPGRTLTSGERYLLLGPSSTVIFYTNLTVCDPNTYRLIRYSSLGSSSSTSSFVFLKESDNSGSVHPQFGSIVSLFGHTFTETTFWAVLDFFAQPTYNNDCKLWYVPISEPFIQRSIIPLNSISYPLVVAKENEHLWFLNYLLL